MDKKSTKFRDLFKFSLVSETKTIKKYKLKD